MDPLPSLCKWLPLCVLTHLLGLLRQGDLNNAWLMGIHPIRVLNNGFEALLETSKGFVLAVDDTLVTVFETVSPYSPSWPQTCNPPGQPPGH